MNRINLLKKFCSVSICYYSFLFWLSVIDFDVILQGKISTLFIRKSLRNVENGRVNIRKKYIDWKKWIKKH